MVSERSNNLPSESGEVIKAFEKKLRKNWRAENFVISRSSGVKPTICLSGRSTCEKQDIKHVVESRMTTSKSNNVVSLNCIIPGDEFEDIFTEKENEYPASDRPKDTQHHCRLPATGSYRIFTEGMRCREPYLHHGGQTTAKYYRVGSTLRREKITHFSLPEGFAQNIIQLESSYETNKRKRKRDDGDNYDYIYGIVSTTRDWHFLLYNPGRISQGSKLPLSIEFSEDALDKKSVEYQTLCNGVKKVLSVVVGIIKDRACAEEEPDRKRARVEGYRSKK
ncbi:hypothetical protein GLOIN_2v1587390 [Rhizophagus clarus]|uniref:Uncharacterized protein n=1 Tax=Rhizophagus clarus TaxID=94130 RepID=A0A8H3LY46_9GLOM|nr:hypothetical protein GLOIN_2v1587390 [Rhizophagus clarus]